MSLGITIHQYSKHLPALIISIDVDPFNNNNICTGITEVDDNIILLRVRIDIATALCHIKKILH